MWKVRENLGEKLVTESHGFFCLSKKSGNIFLNADYFEINKSYDFYLKNILIVFSFYLKKICKMVREICVHDSEKVKGFVFQILGENPVNDIQSGHQ